MLGERPHWGWGWVSAASSMNARDCLLPGRYLGGTWATWALLGGRVLWEHLNPEEQSWVPKSWRAYEVSVHENSPCWGFSFWKPSFPALPALCFMPYCFTGISFFASPCLLGASLIAQLVKICLQCRRPGFYPWIGKIPWEGNGNPLQYSCLEKFIDRRAWQAIVHGVAWNWAQLIQ